MTTHTATASQLLPTGQCDLDDLDLDTTGDSGSLLSQTGSSCRRQKKGDSVSLLSRAFGSAAPD
ncbi:hypothetical protein E2C01_099315 [Portunus trituberculatus]|uniref:Uncharacterized protein n=1 Tax=Portunus trituberculatus TaxID=210409 RepID=A0A5B7KEK3_PORTR|nr:hypothetical protein [Portunus trituberculatus]